jgi:hypothetical protein
MSAIVTQSKTFNNYQGLEWGFWQRKFMCFKAVPKRRVGGAIVKVPGCGPSGHLLIGAQKPDVTRFLWRLGSSFCETCEYYACKVQSNSISVCGRNLWLVQICQG